VWVKLIFWEVVLCVNLSKKKSVYVRASYSWLQIQRSGFDSQRYQIFCAVVGLELGPLSLVRTTEELLDRKVAAPV
jgi:hypothetical protein